MDGHRLGSARGLAIVALTALGCVPSLPLPSGPALSRDLAPAPPYRRQTPPRGRALLARGSDEVASLAASARVAAAMIAVLIGLWATGTPLNISSMMGMTMIVGVVTEVETQRPPRRSSTTSWSRRGSRGRARSS